MNILLIFFALPIATIILAAVLEKILHCPLAVAAVFFAIFLVVTFAFFDATFLIATIIYTILAFLSAAITRGICKILSDDDDRDEDDEDDDNDHNCHCCNCCNCRERSNTISISNGAMGCSCRRR